jgi:hypothetical protein
MYFNCNEFDKHLFFTCQIKENILSFLLQD